MHIYAFVPCAVVFFSTLLEVGQFGPLYRKDNVWFNRAAQQAGTHPAMLLTKSEEVLQGGSLLLESSIAKSWLDITKMNH